MATIIETIQKRNFLPTRPLKEDLPTFSTAVTDGGLRKRLSSFSLNFPAPSLNSSFSKSTSLPSVNSFWIKNWLGWGMGWILSRKLDLVSDLEMNEEEIAALGWQNKGSLRHLLYRAQSSFRRLFVEDGKLPMSQKAQSDYNAHHMEKQVE